VTAVLGGSAHEGNDCNDGDNMRRFSLAQLGVAVGFLVMCASLSAQKVAINLDKTFDFTNHRRYAWRQNHIITRQGKQNDALIDQKIVQDVNRTLAEKGFVEDTANPDFFISYEAGAGGFTGEVEGFHAGPAPRLNEPQGPVYGIPQNVWYSVDGHIIFHLVDAKSDQPIWTATVTKKIRDPHKGMKDMEKQMEQIVSKTFKAFPPRPK
jgi:hypothetical protein